MASFFVVACGSHWDQPQQDIPVEFWHYILYYASYMIYLYTIKSPFFFKQYLKLLESRNESFFLYNTIMGVVTNRPIEAKLTAFRRPELCYSTAKICTIAMSFRM